MDMRQQTRRLYIADLAVRQHVMELAPGAMRPLAYRVLSRQLRQALAGMPEAAACDGFPELPDNVAAHLIVQLLETVEMRHFNDHGRLLGPQAEACKAVCDALLARLRG